MSCIAWNDLVIGYKKAAPLNHAFSGQIDRPGIYAIVGQNGCGKSTLLKTLLGLLAPLSGQVTIGDTPLPKQHHISQGIAYVPQFHSVNPYFHITVLDFVSQGFGPQHTLTPDNKTEIKSLLAQWQLTGFESKSFHELSGGQKVRSMLVRAIISKPKFLFLDEPLASLDLCCQNQLMETLKNLVTEKQVCVFMVDHHFENFSSYITQRVFFTRQHDEEKSSIRIV